MFANLLGCVMWLVQIATSLNCAVCTEAVRVQFPMTLKVTLMILLKLIFYAIHCYRCCVYLLLPSPPFENIAQAHGTLEFMLENIRNQTPAFIDFHKPFSEILGRYLRLRLHIYAKHMTFAMRQEKEFSGKSAARFSRVI